MRVELKDNGNVMRVVFSEMTAAMLKWVPILLFSNGKSQTVLIILGYFILQQEDY